MILCVIIFRHLNLQKIQIVQKMKSDVIDIEWKTYCEVDERDKSEMINIFGNEIWIENLLLCCRK